jgi:hypothetical protein
VGVDLSMDIDDPASEVARRLPTWSAVPMQRIIRRELEPAELASGDGPNLMLVAGHLDKLRGSL